MQVIKKLFGWAPAPAAPPESAEFHESDATNEIGSRNAPRRELVHVVLRDSMRRHGIPSAWIECRILSMLSRNSKTGMHVQLIVRDGTDRLLTYVPAFQTSFMQEIARFDPRVDDWLLSLSWQFHNLTAALGSTMPDPATWARPVPPGTPATTPAPRPASAVAAPAAKEAAPAPTQAPASAVPAVPVPDPVDRAGDDEVLDDLRALYAIRDAALGRPARGGPSGEQDFESTRPGSDLDQPPPPPRRW